MRGIWLLKYEEKCRLFGELFWVRRGKWPRPNGFSPPRAFQTRHDAEEFLFKQRRMGRDVSRWRPYCIRVDSKAYRVAAKFLGWELS